MEIPADSLLHNRYRVIRQLGKGGMGAVYLAQDQALEHVVAVKRNQSRSPQAAAQFLREAQLLASLRHPNLPRVIDYFLVDSDQYLVMDYIPGDDLEVLLNQVGAMPLDQVLVWTEQIISALSYLHRQNPPVVHRDIKPANLKLTPEGEVILVDLVLPRRWTSPRPPPPARWVTPPATPRRNSTADRAPDRIPTSIRWPPLSITCSAVKNQPRVCSAC